MKNAILALFLTLFSLASCGSKTPALRNTATPHRIVSLAPSLTETLYALGADSLLVGISQFCAWPDSVSKKPVVGGYLDPSIEQIISRSPDLILVLREHRSLQSTFIKAGLRSLMVTNSTLDELLASFDTIGALTHTQPRADSIKAAILAELPNDTAGPHPRVLICVGRANPGVGTISGVFAAGRLTFLSDIVRRCGGTNVYADSAPVYPQFSAEGIIRLAPEIVIDLTPSNTPIDTTACIRDWTSLSRIPAVSDSCVFAMSGSYASIPGPRATLTAHDIRAMIDHWKAHHNRHRETS